MSVKRNARPVIINVVSLKEIHYVRLLHNMLRENTVSSKTPGHSRFEQIEKKRKN